MSAPPRPQLGLPSPRPDGSEDPYFQDQWSDDPADDDDDAPRRRTRTHNISSRSTRSSYVPSGQGARGEVVGRPTPYRADTDPFAPTSGPRTRPYSGYYGPPPTSQTPFTQPYSSPPGGYSQGPGYYSSGYDSGYTTAPPPTASPFTSRPYYPSTPADPSPFGYSSTYAPPPSQPFGPSHNDGRTGVRGPTIRVQKTAVEPQPQPRARQVDDDRDRVADEKYWRDRQRQKVREEREAQKKEKERERRELNRVKFERMKLQLDRLRNQLDMERSERSRGLARGDSEPGLRAQDIMQYLQAQRELESQRKLAEQNDSMTQLLQNLADFADAKRESRDRQDRLQFLGGLPARSASRSSFGDSSYERRREIEEVLRDFLLRPGLWDEDVTRLPLPARSHHTGRSADDLYPEEDYQRGMPRTYRQEEGDVSPRSRYSDAAANTGDPHAGPSSPRHRTGEPGPSIIRDRDPYPSPDSSRYAPSRFSAPPLERRQTAPPAGPSILKVPPLSSSKRPRGSDFSSPDRGEYAPYEHREEVAEQYQQFQSGAQSGVPRRTEQYRDELPPMGERLHDDTQRSERGRGDTPRRMEPERPELRRAGSHRSSGTKKSTISAPRSAHSPERGPRRNRSRSVAFQDQDPTGGRPILEDESASESEVISRRAEPYAFVSGQRYNPRGTPPFVPEAPRSETPTVTDRSPRRPRRPQVEDDWSDDEEVRGGRSMSYSRESTLGR